MKSLQLITEKMKLSANYMKWLKPIFTKFKGSPWKEVEVDAEPYNEDSNIVAINLIGNDPNDNKDIEFIYGQDEDGIFIDFLQTLNDKDPKSHNTKNTDLKKEMQTVLSQMISKYIKNMNK